MEPRLDWPRWRAKKDLLCGSDRHQHHIQGQGDQHMGQRGDKSHRHNRQCEKKEVILGNRLKDDQ